MAAYCNDCIEPSWPVAQCITQFQKWEKFNNCQVMDENNAASVVYHLHKLTSTQSTLKRSEDVTDCDCKCNNVNVVLTCSHNLPIKLHVELQRGERSFLQLKCRLVWVEGRSVSAEQCVRVSAAAFGGGCLPCH